MAISNIWVSMRNFMPFGLIENRFKSKVNTSQLLGDYANPPSLYNSQGELMKVVYLRDENIGSNYYSFTRSRNPQRIFWDKKNAFLPIHVYGHRNIFETFGIPKKKFAILVETEEIDPYLYNQIISNKKNMDNFDCIFTHSSRVLDKYKNARFIPAGGVWYGLPIHGGCINETLYKNKSKNISIVSSNKEMCELHKLRIRIANRCKSICGVDTFGTFDGGDNIKIGDSLQDYRFSIVVENTITEFCFTEKILNCFASMTIPIYIGATCINRFFNADGIIKITPIEAEKDLDDIIHLCTENYYKSRVSAILDNFSRVQNYLCQEDYIMNNYGDFFEL